MPFQSHVQFSGMGEYILGAPKEASGQTSSAHIVGFLLFGASFPPKARKSRGNNVARTKVSSARHLLTTAGRDKFWGRPRCFVFAFSMAVWVSCKSSYLSRAKLLPAWIHVAWSTKCCPNKDNFAEQSEYCLPRRNRCFEKCATLLPRSSDKKPREKF